MVEDMAMSMLAASAPLLAVYLVGGVLALFWLRRHRASAGLLLGGCVVLLINQVVHSFGLKYLFMLQFQGDGSGVLGLDPEQGRVWLSSASTLVNMIGLSLLIAAALVGRKPSPTPGR